jgi:hypothetical protein
MKGTRRTIAAVIVVATTAAACGSYARTAAGAQSSPSASESASATGSPSPSPSQGQAQTFHSESYNFDVSYPAGWTRATEQLTILGEPDELLAVGTFSLVKGGGCAPKDSVAAADPDDAIVFLTEYSSVKGTNFPPRPDRFGPLVHPEPNDCWDVPVSVYQFRDQDGRFQAEVWAGPEASEQTRMEAAGILDSLAFGTRDGLGPFFDRIATYLRVKGSPDRVRRPAEAQRRHAAPVRQLGKKVRRRLRNEPRAEFIEHVLAVYISRDDRFGHFRRLSYIVHIGPFDTGDCLSFYNARTLEGYQEMCFITDRDL